MNSLIQTKNKKKEKSFNYFPQIQIIPKIKFIFKIFKTHQERV